MADRALLAGYHRCQELRGGYFIDTHSVENHNMVDPNGICCSEGPGVISIQSAEMPLAVSGDVQPRFTLGLPMVALSLRFFLSLLWGPHANILFFIHVKDIIWRTQTKSWKIWLLISIFDGVCRTNIDKVGNVFYWRFSSVVPPVHRSVWHGGLEAHWSYLHCEGNVMIGPVSVKQQWKK